MSHSPSFHVAHDEAYREHSPLHSTSNPVTQPSSGPPKQPPPPSFCEACKEKLDLTLLLSVLSVACWALAGNAARLALHGAFLSIPFFSTYEFFGPNCIGSFAMGLFAFALPAEKDLPMVHRALGVGFCGSFTTFSSWVVDVVNKPSASGAFEELLSGLTMPFVFFLWGKDVALGGHWLLRKLRGCCAGTRAADEGVGTTSSEVEVTATATATRRARRMLLVQYVWLALSCAAAIAIPIGVQVRINQGHIHTVSNADIRAVVLGPVGAVLRFLLAVFLNKRAAWHGFPVGTLAANVLGVFLVVFMDNYTHQRPGDRWFWIVANGICGSLSTVSSFVNEVFGFYSAQRPLMCYLYALVTLALTIAIGAIGRRSNFS